MKVEPLGDKILVRRLDAAEKTSGGLFLPESAQDKPTQGKVLLTQKVSPDGVNFT